MAQQLTCPHCHAQNKSNARFCIACGKSLVANATGMLPPNAVLQSRYIILGKLGQGGFGAVYRASDQRFNGKLWAIKEMSDSQVPPALRANAIQEFKREADMLAGLNHPNLPRVIDLFEENTNWYLVMDFIDGQNLETILTAQGAPLAPDDVVEWAIQLCEVLTYLHTQTPPIIFRDLKPENILRETKTGRIKLVDFGIARFFKGGQSKDTTLLGTPGYASPEQHGQTQTDARSDIYSLGVTMHHLVTGYNPALTPFTLPAPRARNPKLSVTLEQVIVTATQIDPTKRYQTAELMRTALLGLSAKPAAPATTPPAPAPNPKPAWKVKVEGTNVATDFKLAPDGNTVAIASVYTGRYSTDRKLVFLDRAGQSTDKLITQFENTRLFFSPDSRYVASLASANGEDLHFGLGFYDRGGSERWNWDFHQVAKWSCYNCQTENTLQNQNCSKCRTARKSYGADVYFKGRPFTAVVASNGQYAALAVRRDEQTLVQVISAPDKFIEFPLAQGTAEVRALAISNDNTALVFGSNVATGFIRLNQKQWEHSFASHVVAISSDGSRVFSGSSDYLVRCLDMQGRLMWQPLDVGVMIKHLVCTPNGQSVALASGGLVKMINSGIELWTHDLGETLTALRIMNDGSGVLAATKKNLYHLVGTPARVNWEAQMDFEIRDITITPTGAFVAAGVRGDEVCYFRT